MEAEIGKRIDAIWNCFTVNPERQEAYTLSKPYMVNAQLVVVLKGLRLLKLLI
ncbi:MAG: transporter substrate-binding domain-containing protein [Phascolarctobacterium faecium]